MQQNASPRKPRHTGRWIVAIVAVLEIAVVVGIFFWVRNGLCAAGMSPALGRAFGSGVTSAEPSPGSDAGTVSPQPQASGNQPEGSASGAASAQGAGASGDLNEVPDPNCVGKAAAGVLNSDEATTAPSCAPMSPPPELKQAEKQVQTMGTPTP